MDKNEYHVTFDIVLAVDGKMPTLCDLEVFFSKIPNCKFYTGNKSAVLFINLNGDKNAPL